MDISERSFTESTNTQSIGSIIRWIFRMSYGYSHQSLSPWNFKDIPISVVLGWSSLTNTLSKMAIICTSTTPPEAPSTAKKLPKNAYVPWVCHHVDGPLITKLHWVTLGSSQVAPMARSIQLLGSPSIPWWRWSSKIFFVKFNIQIPKEIMDRLKYEKMNKT